MVALVAALAALVPVDIQSVPEDIDAGEAAKLKEAKSKTLFLEIWLRAEKIRSYHLSFSPTVPQNWTERAAQFF